MICRSISFKEAGRVLLMAALFSALVLIGPAPSVTAQGQVESMEPAMEESSRGELREVVAETSAVEWEKALEHPRLDNTRLTESQRRSARRSPVPVLLPDRDDLLQNAEIATGDYFYAAQMRDDDVTISVIGASKVIRAPGVPEPLRLGDPGLEVSQGEGLARLSFRAFGVHYDLEVDCPDPVNDSRCAEDAYVLDLADSLLMAVTYRPRR